jgi:hypothetical protein
VPEARAGFLKVLRRLPGFRAKADNGSVAQ